MGSHNPNRNVVWPNPPAVVGEWCSIHIDMQMGLLFHEFSGTWYGFWCWNMSHVTVDTEHVLYNSCVCPVTLVCWSSCINNTKCLLHVSELLHVYYFGPPFNFHMMQWLALTTVVIFPLISLPASSELWMIVAVIKHAYLPC